MSDILADKVGATLVPTEKKILQRKVLRQQPKKTSKTGVPAQSHSSVVQCCFPTDFQEDASNVGHVLGVRAWDDVSGSITALTSIGTVIAGGDVDSVLTAPSVAAPVENDRTGFTGYSPPADNLDFDWLGALAIDLVHHNALLSDSIAASVTATTNATAAAQRQMQADLINTQSDLALIIDVATQRSANRSAHIATDASLAKEGATYQGKLIATSIDQSIKEMEAKEAGSEKMVAFNVLTLTQSMQSKHTSKSLMPLVHRTLDVMSSHDPLPIYGLINPAICAYEGNTEEAKSSVPKQFGLEGAATVWANTEYMEMPERIYLIEGTQLANSVGIQ